MIYAPELYYFFDTPGFPLMQAVKVTVKSVASFCDRYEARLLAPKPGTTEVEQSGNLPRSTDDLIDWFELNSDSNDLFSLFMWSADQKESDIAKFDHHDDTCCWALNLSEDEFKIVQKAWRENGLPEDLFFPADQEKTAPEKVRYLKGLFTLTFKKTYTPKQWEAKQKGQ
ncbi:MAG: hypothetical protein K0S20_317 [Patescibacteria group bacterium]|nr:hypothetical protein [Patescibacteria group bacterium]